jgi:hypothetical protein
MQNVLPSYQPHHHPSLSNDGGAVDLTNFPPLNACRYMETCLQIIVGDMGLLAMGKCDTFNPADGRYPSIAVHIAHHISRANNALPGFTATLSSAWHIGVTGVSLSAEPLSFTVVFFCAIGPK